MERRQVFPTPQESAHDAPFVRECRVLVSRLLLRVDAQTQISSLSSLTAHLSRWPRLPSSS